MGYLGCTRMNRVCQSLFLAAHILGAWTSEVAESLQLGHYTVFVWGCVERGLAVPKRVRLHVKNVTFLTTLP